MINQIILSCNEDPKYSSFWKPVSYAYKKMFPDVQVHLAFLTNRTEDEPLVQEFREYGKVTLFKPVDWLSEFSQAKMIRFILASEQTDICYIDDIDIFPLNKAFITDKTDSRPFGSLLCVGGEVYNNNGCYPISQMTAEGYIWKKFINPENLDYEDLLKSYQKPVKFDRREDMKIVTDFDKDNYFSDERLLRRLISENPVPKREIRRGYDNFMEATVDRFNWKVDPEKLNGHQYMNAHGVRPYERELYKPLMDYINENF
jgi:hypothetical protein